MRGDVLTWTGLGLLVAGLVAGLFPMLPALTTSGPMLGVPHPPAWGWAGAALAGVALMLWGRRRDTPR